MLAAFAGWVIIGGVPAILHTPLMSGFNFVRGIVVVGGLFTLLNASTVAEQAIGFLAVLLGAGNAAGGYAVTDRMLAMFQVSRHKARHAKSGHPKARRPPGSACATPRQSSLSRATVSPSRRDSRSSMNS